MKEKKRPVSPEQSTSALINTNSDAAPREAERDHDDKRRRVDELVSPVFTVAQDEVLASSPVHFYSETKNDEIGVDVALPEGTNRNEYRKRSGLDHGRSILHILAWLPTNATAQGSKDESLVTCREA